MSRLLIAPSPRCFSLSNCSTRKGAQISFGAVGRDFAFARVTTELEELRVIERARIIEHLASQRATHLAASPESTILSEINIGLHEAVHEQVGIATDWSREVRRRLPPPNFKIFQLAS